LPEKDFVQQTHIRQARNWMAAIGHAIHEVVSLHRCRCGQSYEQCGNQPTPPCPACEKIRLKNTGPGKRKRENNERKDRIPAANLIIPPLGPTSRYGSTPDRTPLQSWQKRDYVYPENPENLSKMPKGSLPL